MEIDRYEEHIDDASARPIVGGILLTFTATRPQGSCTERTPWLKEASVSLPWQHAQAIHDALADDRDYHHDGEGLELTVTGPPDEYSAGWFIARYGEHHIEVDLTTRSVRQVQKALGEALTGPRPHPFIRMYEHSELHDRKGRSR